MFLKCSLITDGDRSVVAVSDTLATQTLSGPAGFVDDSPYFYLDGDVSEYDIDAAFAVDGERPGTSRYEDEIHLTNPVWFISLQ